MKKIIAVSVCLFVVLMCCSMLFAQKAPAGPIVLKGAPMGGVKFEHSKHPTVKCDVCHHASKAEKPAKTKEQACTDCHTKIAAAPMKTKLQAAFHNPTAKAGLCVDCHVKEAAAGKKAPTKCADCHKKENV